ncbi:alanine racemase [Pseudarthrobacter sp. P1]|uniref:alanine racemase n=1 Tax=Pseudarthrobacter sp. P1 TaxID=3418418 RepID=UPI003CF1E31C
MDHSPRTSNVKSVPATVVRHRTNPTERLGSWLEIDAEAFEHNIRALGARLAGRSSMCAVVKADAYGHGLDVLAPSLVSLDLPAIGVARNEEARIVRGHGYTGRLIRVRPAAPGEIDDGMAHGIEEMIGNLHLAQKADAIARRKGRALRYHFAVNSSGLSRDGLELAGPRGRAEARAMLALPHLVVAGITTHFPMEQRDDVRAGLDCFLRDSAWFIRQGLDRQQVLLHCATSFAALEVPESWLDMVRAGATLYGDSSPTHREFKRVMAFKARVASVNEYPAGNTVGYDRAHTLHRASRLASVTVGYADGYRRVLAGKAHVLVRGRRAPVLDKISMNVLVADVTDIDGVAPGDEVVLFGRQGDSEITPRELEDANGALFADLYTVWGNSNPKILKGTRQAMQPDR